MRDSRWPRGTCTAPGTCDCSNSCCSRTSTITAPLPFCWSSWTSFGSTSWICSLILRISSAPDAIFCDYLDTRSGFNTSQSVAPSRSDTPRPQRQPGRPFGRPGRRPRPRLLCGSPGSCTCLSLTRSFVQAGGCRYGVKTPFLVRTPLPIHEKTLYDATRRLPDRPGRGRERRPRRDHAVRGEPGGGPRPHRERPALVVPHPCARDPAHALCEPVDAPAPVRAARAADHPDRGDRPRRAVEPPASRAGPGRGDRQAVALLQRSPRAHRGGAPPLRDARDARAGGGAPPPRARPPRRGEPGAHGDPAPARGARPGQPARACGGGKRAEASREPGDGRTAEPRAPTAAERARRPWADAGGRDPAQALLSAYRGRGEHRVGRRPGLASGGRADGGVPDPPGG